MSEKFWRFLMTFTAGYKTTINTKNEDDYLTFDIKTKILKNLLRKKISA